jgi:hypothetical protein
LSPLAIGRLKLTSATLFGFAIPSGGSKLEIKSDNCEKPMNCVACGSYLEFGKNIKVRFISAKKINLG